MRVHGQGSWLKQQMGLPVWEGAPVPSDETFRSRDPSGKHVRVRKPKIDVCHSAVFAMYPMFFTQGPFLDTAPFFRHGPTIGGFEFSRHERLGSPTRDSWGLPPSLARTTAERHALD